MKKTKISDLPEDLKEWVLAGIGNERKSNFSVCGFNDRFVLIKKNHFFFDGIANKERKYAEFVVVEWQVQTGFKSFHFKFTGHLTKVVKMTISKNFSINLSTK
jgi:hypothetical protein